MNRSASSRLSYRGFRQWVKRRETPLARLIYAAVTRLRSFSLPVIPFVHRGLYIVSTNLWEGLKRLAHILWYTPLLRSRLETPARRLRLTEGLPAILGPLRIRIGSDCRVSGQTTFSGRTAGTAEPLLQIGDNCDIAWSCTIAVGTKVVLGDNVRLAMGANLSGYPGHPLDAAARARHEPDTDDQVGDIILEDDVWLGARVTVLAGVSIGRGTVVGAGSVVAKDLPPNVLAAGVPARVIREIVQSSDAGALGARQGTKA